MNREQKRALAILVSMSLVLVILGTAVAVRHVVEVRWLSILLLFLAGAVACVGGVVYFRLRSGQGAVLFDERDQGIQRNAALSSMGTAYFLLGLASFAPSYILGEKASVPTAWLPLIVAGAGLCQVYASFISILLQCGRGVKDEP